MSLRVSKKQLVEILDGVCLESNTVRNFSSIGACYDSRQIKGGELFVALDGEVTHGHKFLKSAYELGAALFLIEDESILKDESYPLELRERCVVVDDTLKRFGQLATWWRDELGVPIIAITGSVGKTTVKEITARLLLSASSGFYSEKSYNNHVGVPYSLCSISKEHKWAVLEMGMNNKGEISYLTNMAKPDVVVITCIAASHVGLLGSIENIAKAKLEILEGLKPGGIVVLNGSDRLLLSEYKNLVSDRSEGLSLACLGNFDDNIATELNIEFDSELSNNVTIHEDRGLNGIVVQVDTSSSSLVDIKGLDIKTSLIGSHNCNNISLAVSSCLALANISEVEVSAEGIIKSLKSISLPDRRLNIKGTRAGNLVVDDSYNASLKSMQALFNIAKYEINNGRRVALILGTMLELGDESESAHEKLGFMANSIGAKFIIFVGKFGENFKKNCPQSLLLKDYDEVINELPKLLSSKDIVDLNIGTFFIKGSKSVWLNKVGNWLVKNF